MENTIELHHLMMEAIVINHLVMLSQIKEYLNGLKYI